MTASVLVTTARRSGVLLVPAAALRFVPEEPSKAPSGSVVARLLPRPPGTEASRAPESGRRVFVLREGRPAAVPVVPGLSDGQSTEITGGDLRPGATVVVGDNGSLS